MARKPQSGRSETTAKPALEAYYRQPELWAMERYEGNPVQRLRARVIASLIDPVVDSILDVGCGNGFVTRRLRARKRVVGLDPSEVALAHFDGETVLGTSDALPFEDGEFDAVVCTEVLEHLSDEVFNKTVRELSRVAKQYIVIGVPYRQDLREGMTRCARCGCRYHVDLHQRSFQGPEELEAAIPRFRQQVLTLIGERSQIKSRLFRAIRYTALGARAYSSLAVCPSCKFSCTPTKAHSFAPRTLEWLLDGLAWRMPSRTLPIWMIVLLALADASPGPQHP